MMIDSRLECFNYLLNLSRIISPHSKNLSPIKIKVFKKLNSVQCQSSCSRSSCTH
ncbi:hypothetical protein GIB67_014862 [Kingdonia uniflora]|uniref:Uncharacterized protein n=1 Tax=Kingdonia uniflora TaxID=39325 RepID=A0A7J7MTQ4_9MAGN|nr:hypothetical protein GIB67_014862 [Kingdonia uniflora]